MISLPSENITTGNGAYRYKYSMRAGFRAVAFVTLVAGFCVYNVYSGGDITETAQRRLTSVEAEKSYGIFQEEADPMWTLVLYIFGILYLFLALAIVCDEYFVPALEEMSGENQMNLSRDVAGATLMAAGGSAPELFTSLFGTFSESSVGFGTIVGSAVFNVLFVIGMCAIFSSGELKLTSWPLARDASYYCLSLLVLALFFGVLTPNDIKVYEAAILFAMYFGYVAVMAYNEKLNVLLWGGRKDKVVPEKDEGETKKDAAAASDEPPRQVIRVRRGSMMDEANGLIHNKEKLNVSMNSPFTFRAGILQMMVGQSAADLAGAYAVTQIKGTLRETFEAIDDSQNDDGQIDAKELEMLLVKVSGAPVSQKVVDDTLKKLDTNGDGTICLDEFKVWYVGSTHMVKKQIHAHFTDMDIEGSGLMKKSDTIHMLERMHVEDIAKAEKMAHAEASWTERIHEQILFLITFPLMITMYCTIPDVRNPKYKDWFVTAFVMAIMWIGIYSYFMVAWITLTGNTFSIPVQVMGLTFLAAGTSIPDLLSSVIVAKKGLGDMAVSSSIGSNFFDVLVGLPLPWLVYGIYKTISTDGEVDGVLVVADSLFVSLIILFAMILSVIAIIHLSGWVMTKPLGGAMFLLYIAFVTQDLARTDFS